MFDFQQSPTQALWVNSLADHRARNQAAAPGPRPEPLPAGAPSRYQALLAAIRRLALPPRPSREGAAGCCPSPACC
jgi:hypothetical protein